MQHQPRTSRMDVRPDASLTGVHEPAPAPVDPQVAGTVLGGRYRIGECIGAGAMGVVWTAWDRRLRRTVAVKQLTVPRGDVEEDGAAARLARTRAMREGRIAGRVVHPRAIAVFDVVVQDTQRSGAGPWDGDTQRSGAGPWDGDTQRSGAGPSSGHGLPWLVMEYLPSRSLAAVLAERGPLPPAEAARIGAQVADALSAVHEAGIVHGDIKPGNVLLADDGVAKITDFGVSRATWDVTSTGSGMVAGTPGYFAPEVARGQEPTPASDVFSLGATLYAAVENELVCGRVDNTLAVLHAMAEGRLRPATRAGVLGRPLAAMLRIDAGHRPDTRAVHRALLSRAAATPVPLTPLRAGTATSTGPATSTGAVGVVAAGSADDGSVPAGSASGPADPPRTPDGDLPGVGTASSPLTAPSEDGPEVPAPRSSTPAPVVPAPRPAPASAHSGAASATALGAAAPARDRRRPGRHKRRVLAVTAASAVVLTAGVGAAVATVASGPRTQIAEPAPPVLTQTAPATGAPAVTATPVDPAPTTSTAPPTAAAPLSPGSSGTTTTTPPTPAAAAPGAPVTENDVRATVADYYGSLPGDVAGAWATLSEQARDDSGGYDGYTRFWAGISSVAASGVSVTGQTATASIEFRTSDGITSRETYRFLVDRTDDGRLEIVSAQRGADAM